MENEYYGTHLLEDFQLKFIKENNSVQRIILILMKC